MTTSRRVPIYFLWIISFLIGGIYILGISAVPFHPDESTYLFMSSDVETIFQNSQSLFWTPPSPIDLVTHYRLVDAPLSRYWIGLVRQLFQSNPLPSDWNWSLSWDANIQAGALPSDQLLFVGRLALTLLIPLTLLNMFRIGESIGGTGTGWITFFLTAGNALVLLHARRAMAESMLLVTLAWAISILLQPKFSPWLAGLAAGLAFNAKQSNAAILILGFGILLFEQLPWKKRFVRLFIFTAVVSGVTLLLNPILWTNLIVNGFAMLQERQTLVAAQIQTLAEASPEKALSSIPLRFISLIIHLFFTPPAIADVSNYLAQTEAATSAYLSNPLHTLGRSIPGGIALLVLSVMGKYIALRKIKQVSTSQSLARIHLFTGTILFWLFLGWFIPLPVQRYCLPLLPFTLPWIALCISTIIKSILPFAMKSQRGEKESTKPV